MSNRKKVAVIGSGIAGLTAAYILRRKYDVTLYEADERFGGHTHTHNLTDSTGKTHAVDSGFIVHNISTYPLLLKLFKELNIKTKPTEMSLSISCRGCGIEFTGAGGLRGLFRTPSTLFNVSFLKLMLTVNIFNKDALALLRGSGNETLTLGAFMKKGNYSTYFETHYLLPTVSAIWSCEFDKAKEYPAKYLFQFFENHGMLQTKNLTRNNTWRVIPGGSSSYVKKILPLLQKTLRNTGVTKLERKQDTIIITDSNKNKAHFDKVVIATHPDQALQFLDNPSRLEKEVLGALEYTNTIAQLHTDITILPKNKKVAASWNYFIPECNNSGSTVRISYDMNRLQHILAPERYIVSLDSQKYIDPTKVLATMHYQHPLFTLKSVAAQKRLPQLNTTRLAFAGAYHGWGFHEDGCRSGVAAAAAFGAEWGK